jgi:hypothetical protein
MHRTIPCYKTLVAAIELSAESPAIWFDSAARRAEIEVIEALRCAKGLLQLADGSVYQETLFSQSHNHQPGDSQMAEPLHPAATHPLPFFVTAPGETDVLFMVTAIFVVLAVIGIGVFYFKLHALPEHMAHRGQKVQMEIVAVLALIALFTHNHLFWIAGLLLAMIPLPDFTTPLTSIASSLERIAGGLAPDAPATQPMTDARPARRSPPPNTDQLKQRGA